MMDEGLPTYDRRRSPDRAFFALSTNVLPTLEETARNVYEAIRLRGGF